MTRQFLLRSYIAALMAAAFALPMLAGDWAAGDTLTLTAVLFWMVLVVGAEMTPITLPKGGAALSVGGVIDAAILLLFPSGFCAAFGALAGLTSSVRRRVDTERLIFNIAMVSLTMFFASRVIDLGNAKLYQLEIGTQVDPELIPRVLFPFIAAIMAYFLVNTGLTSIAISIKSGTSILNIWNSNYRWTMASVAAAGPIGLIIAVVYAFLSTVDAFFAILGVSIFFMPILVIRYAHKLFVDVNAAYFNSIRALVSALDASHHYTQGHSLRVSTNSATVARLMRLPDREIELIERGAMLHDIGKIGLEKTILDKPGPLTSLEWMQMKQHPVLGARIIGDLSFLKEEKEIVLYHHERLDGKGYPLGLTADEIPMGARIVNVVDAFDALTSARSYRDALSTEQALEILNVNAGKQFDADIVACVTDLANSDGLILQGSEGDEGADSDFLFSYREIQEVLKI